MLKLLVVVIRTLLGSGEHRISAELERREIGTIEQTSCHKIFQPIWDSEAALFQIGLNLPTKTYHPKGKSVRLKRYRYRRR